MTKKIFVSYAADDKELRDKLLDQIGNINSEVELIEMPGQDPSEAEWRDKCQQKVRESDGVLFIFTGNSINAGEQLWQATCAKKEDKPNKGVWGNFDEKPVSLPVVYDGIKIIKWDSENINTWIESVENRKEG